jgi:phospholipid/cholesterol/gamma-HCH transport system substrate-binding protein
MRGSESRTRLPNWLLGLLIVSVLSYGSYVAYTKELPWADPFEVSAVFTSPQNMRTGSPVRIAGVNVGEVSDVELIGEPVTHADDEERPGVKVTMELSEEALPLAEDSFFKVRPRLFLDGNYFVDLFPGSPSAPEVPDGYTFGLERTAHSVQLDQVLGVFDSDVRNDFQTLLDQFGNALTKYDGAEGLRELYRTSPDAYRYSAVVAEAQLGTERHDLRGMIRGLGKVLGGLSRNEQALRNLITNLRTVTGSFAAENRALGRTVELLPDFLAEGPPTFTRINQALPSLRAFAREALPGVRKSPEALRAQMPLLAELRGLMSRDELRGLVARLRPTVPALAQLARGNIELFTQQRAFSSCFNEVIIPWSNSTVEPVDPGDVYPLEVGGRTFEETAYGFTGSASESRSGDAMGQHLRVLGGGGTNLVRFDGPQASGDVFGLTPFPILGVIPRLHGDSAKTRFRPGRPCEKQEPPNLQAGVGEPPADQGPAPTSSLADLDGPGAERLQELMATLKPDGLADLAALAPAQRRQEIDSTQRLVDRLGFNEIDVAALVEEARR